VRRDAIQFFGDPFQRLEYRAARKLDRPLQRTENKRFHRIGSLADTGICFASTG
jgi:hypothetical protein